MNMTLRQLLTVVGIELLELKKSHPPRWLHILGDPPGSAFCGRDFRTKRLVVVGLRGAPSQDNRVRRFVLRGWYADEVLHEACHLLCGPSSLVNEEALMVYQWALMQRLIPTFYSMCRGVFSLYGLPSGEMVGETEDFLQSPVWRGMTDEAIEKGYVSASGEPLLRGVHSLWEVEISHVGL